MLSLIYKYNFLFFFFLIQFTFSVLFLFLPEKVLKWCFWGAILGTFLPVPREQVQTIGIFIEPLSVQHKQIAYFLEEAEKFNIKCTILGAIGMPEPL